MSENPTTQKTNQQTTNNDIDGAKVTLGRVIDSAKQGRREVLPTLRQALEDHPELWQHYGNLGLQAQANWLQLIGGENLYLKECLERHCEALRTELAGPEASPLEKLQVERIVALNLQVNYFEALVARQEAATEGKVPDYLHQRHSAADRRLQDAITQLAKIRRLLPHTLRVDLVVSGEVQTTITGASEKAGSGTNAAEEPVHIRVPRNRVKDLLTAATN